MQNEPVAPAGATANATTAAPQFVEELLQQAETAGASDIHLQMNGRRAEISFRLDGAIVPMRSVEEPLAERVFGRIKYLAALKTYQEKMPQDGRIAKTDLLTAHDVRVATYPTVTGEKIVLRLFREQGPTTLSGLGFARDAVAALESCLRQGGGLLLLTGPAGSGKTTTIYGCLRYLASLGGRHIITVEDPVEQIIPSIMQTEVAEERGLTFAKAARHLLRQDPQVLVLGEIRDEESAAIAVRGALTGHLMISTLHAGSCDGVVERLLTLSSDAAALVSALEMVFNQRLVRKLCRHCAGHGCAACFSTGYRGRQPIAEWVRWGSAEREAYRQRRILPAPTTPTMKEQAVALVEAGTTNLAEIERILG